jgi:peptidoglycan/xylan/chitin deacetylase (PgdA/CDA1 family)
MIGIAFSVLGIFIWWFFRPRKGVRVLMYHKISEQETDFLTVNIAQFDSHLNYVKKVGFHFITTQNLLDFYLQNKPLPPKPLLITFDDGYVNNLTLADPILKKHEAKATIFIPTDFVEKTNEWDHGADSIMSVEQLKNLAPMNAGSVFELALHSHTHLNYANLSLPEIEADLRLNIAFFEKNNINYTPALAYPYGGRPKGASYNAMINIFKQLGVLGAFRIGNRINPLVINDLYALNRIDIRGNEGFWRFKMKVIWGRIF